MENNFELFTKIKVDLDEFKKAMKEVSKLTGKLIDGLEDDFEDLEKDMSKELKDFQKDVKKTTKKVGEEFEDLADDIEDEFEDIGDAAEDTMKGIEKQTKKTTKNVSKEFDKMADDATDDFDDINDDFEDATKGMERQAEKVADDVVDAFDDMSDKAGSNFDKINSDFKSSVGKLSDISKSVTSEIQNNFKSVDDGLKGNFDSIGSQFGSSIGDMVGESRGIVDRVQSAFDGLTTGLRSKFSQISSTFKSATGDMPSVASNLSAGVDNKIRQMGANAKKIFSKVEDDYKLGTDEINPTTKDVVKKTGKSFGKISDTFGKVMSDIRKDSSDTSGKVTDEWVKAGNDIEKAFDDLQNELDLIDFEETSEAFRLKDLVDAGDIDFSEAEREFEKVANASEKSKNEAVDAFNDIKDEAIESAKKSESAWQKVKNKFKSIFGKIESEATETADEMGSEFKEAGDKTESALDGIKGALAGIAGAVTAAFGVGAISGMIDEAKELNKELGKVLFSMSQMGMSKGASTKAYASVYSVIGDEGRAGETIQNLTRVAKSEKELMKMAELVTDTHLVMGEAVTPEALAESIALSAQKGEIDGVLADVVERCGISEEKFAEKLEGTKNQTEALNLITKTLSGTFAGATAEYKKANPEMTKLNEATAEQQVAMMNLGETLAPLKTKLVGEFLTPLYNWLAEKLPPAIATFNGWLDKIKSKLSEVDWGAWWSDLKELGGYISGTLETVFGGLYDNLSNIAESLGLYDPSKDAGKGTGVLKSFFKFTEEHGQGIADAITVIGIAVAGCKLAGWINGISLALASNPFMLLVAGLTLAVGTILVFQDEIEEFGTNFQNTLQTKIGDPIGETFDDWYGRFFENPLEDMGKFLRGETDWQKKCGEQLDKLEKKFEDFKEGLGKTFGGKAIKWIGNIFIDFLNSPIDAIKAGINGIVSGINWLLELVNSPDRLPKIPKDFCSIPRLAKGTDNWRGGTAIVGEAGQEIVNMPNGDSFVTQGATLMNLPKGAQVIPNRIAKHLIKGGVRGFADGLNVKGWFSDIIDYMINPSKIIDDLKAGFSSVFKTDGMGSILSKGFKSWLTDKFFGGDTLAGFIKDKIESLFDWSIFGGGAGSDYTAMIKKAASFFGDTLTSNELARVIQQINTESGGDPNAVQSIAVWDINAKTGNLAQGLLQYVPSTFKGYAVKGYNDIRNPYHQLLAFFNNSTWRKALPKLGEIRGWTPRGARRMADGGLVKGGHGGIFANIGEAAHDELVIPLNQQGVKPLASSLVEQLEQSGDIGGGDVTVHVTIPLDGKVIAEETIHITDKLNERKGRRSGKR